MSVPLIPSKRIPKQFDDWASRRHLTSIALVATMALIAFPIIGWPSVLRLPAVVAPAIILALFVVKPWNWTDGEWKSVEQWRPQRRVIALVLLAVGILLFWLIVTRFWSAEINAVDFTVYFDRPCYQTIYNRRALLVETADVASFSNRSELAVHAFWSMLPICALYAIHPTPYWLLMVSVVAVAAGAMYMFRVATVLG